MANFGPAPSTVRAAMFAGRLARGGLAIVLGHARPALAGGALEICDWLSAEGRDARIQTHCTAHQSGPTNLLKYLAMLRQNHLSIQL